MRVGRSAEVTGWMVWAVVDILDSFKFEFYKEVLSIELFDVPNSNTSFPS